MKLQTIYLDLDGPLVDFTRGAMAAHGFTLPPLDITWNFYEQVNLSAEAFWKPLGRDFWANLDWTAEGKLLLANLRDAVVSDDRILIVSSPCDTEGCCDGKREWVRRELGPEWVKRLVLTQSKHLLASPTKLLIDDHGDNCSKFTRAGGHAILVPRPWNQAKPLCEPDGTFNVLNFNATFNTQIGPVL